MQNMMACQLNSDEDTVTRSSLSHRAPVDSQLSDQANCLDICLGSLHIGGFMYLRCCQTTVLSLWPSNNEMRDGVSPQCCSCGLS